MQLMLFSWQKALRRARMLLLVFFVGSMPLVIYPAATSYPYAKGVYAVWMVSALLVLWVGEGALRRSRRLRWPLVVPWLGALAVAAFSTVGVGGGGGGGGGGLGLGALLAWGTFALLYGLIANAAATLGQVRVLLGGLVMAGTIVASYGLMQFWGWLAGPLGTQGAEAMISTLGNVNYVASFLSFLLVPGLALVLTARLPLFRIAGMGALGLMAMALWAAGSVGAWVAWVISLGSFTGLWLQRTGFRSRRILSLIAGTVVGIGILGIAAGITAGLLTSSAVEGADTDLATGRSGKMRLWNALTALAMLRDHPLRGVGLGRYSREFLDYKAKLLQEGWAKRLGIDFYLARSEQAHNEYLQLAAETGLIGVLVFAWALIKGLCALRRSPPWASENPNVRLLSWGLLAGGIAILVDSLYDFPLHRPSSALVAVVYLGLLSGRGLRSGIWRSRLSLKIKIGPSLRRGMALFAMGMVVVIWPLGYFDLRANVLWESARRDLALGRLAAAEAKLERGLRWALEPSGLLFTLGEVYYQRGEYERAVRALERALAGLAEERLYLRLAQAYAAMNEEERAWSYVQALLATEPHPVHKRAAYLLRAELWRRSGDYDQALAQLEHVLRQDPKAVEAYTLAARIYEERGDRLSARDAYRRGLEAAQSLLSEKRAELARAQAAPSGLPFERWWRLLREIRDLEAQRERIRRALDALQTEPLLPSGRTSGKRFLTRP